MLHEGDDEYNSVKRLQFYDSVTNFEGTPTGIDVVKVLNTGILPIINTGIVHKKPGIGQIGVGIARAPMECFKKVLKALVEKHK